MTTLQACDKVTHVHLMIFILTKTQRKSIEVHSTFTGKKSLLQISEKNNVSWEFSKTLFVLEERSALLVRIKIHILELYYEFDNLVTVSKYKVVPRW